MSLEIIDVHLVYETISERGTRGKLLGVCDTREAAARFHVGKGWYGGNGIIERGKAIKFQGKVYPIIANEPMTLITEQNFVATQAMAKLTQEEIEALRATL